MKKIILSSVLAGIIGINAAMATGNNDAGLVASKAYVDTKQSAIPAAEVDFLGDGDYMLPSLVSYDTENGLVGNRIGILDMETVTETEGSLGMFNDYSYEDGEMDNFVPTVRAVANGLTEMQDIINHTKQGNIPKSGYKYVQNNTPYTTNAATNNYSWLNANVKGTGLVTRTSTDGQIGERKIIESSDVASYNPSDTSIAQQIREISIPTMGAVMTAITNGTQTLSWSATQTAATNNYSTTFNGNTGNWPTADSAKLVTGNALANAMALKQNKKTCAGWPDDTPENMHTYDATHTDANCWLWTFD